MELTQLRSFLRVAEEGSITRAADSLFLTQPAVTQHVRALERELGVALFDRTGRGVQLTAAGVALRDYAKRSLSILDECRQVIADLQSGTTGRLVIGAGVTTSIFSLPRWLNLFQQEFPYVDVVVRTGASAEISNLILQREIDLGLVTSPTEHPDLRITTLYEEEIVLVSPANHPPAEQILRPEDLTNAPLIMFPPGTGFRTYLDRSLPEFGISARVKMQTDSVEAIKSFVAIGLGLSFLPLSAVDAEINAGTLVRLEVKDMPPLKRKTSVVYHTGRYLSRAAQGFLDLLAELHAGMGLT